MPFVCVRVCVCVGAKTISVEGLSMGSSSSFTLDDNGDDSNGKYIRTFAKSVGVVFLLNWIFGEFDSVSAKE